MSARAPAASGANSDMEEFFEELLRAHSQECDASNLADAVREPSSDTEESVSVASYPTWWSDLIKNHTSHIEAPKTSAEFPIRAMSACSGMCPEIAVFQVARLKLF